MHTHIQTSICATQIIYKFIHISIHVLPRKRAWPQVSRTCPQTTQLPCTWDVNVHAHLHCVYAYYVMCVLVLHDGLMVMNEKCLSLPCEQGPLNLDQYRPSAPLVSIDGAWRHIIEAGSWRDGMWGAALRACCGGHIVAYEST